eukprot:CAMPEP_0196781590 /NCGR_PEP_ID=MMETSP1104-20130614/9894_1 /TAXON_ID=33652 /ORGANISM="Cafeteria sp., Strain Caron Lab Isolate" /LENGTH=147 /DNA_ID=CAMNT_0042151823 /DNA_START=21 /DNA_END=464 /DNA_ORIENTATION=-
MRVAVAILVLAVAVYARRDDGARALERGKLTAVSGKKALSDVVGHGTAVVATYHRSEDSFHESIEHVLRTVAEHFEAKPIRFVSINCDSAPNAQLCEDLPVYQRPGHSLVFYHASFDLETPPTSTAFFPSDKAHTAQNVADWINGLL